jgi:hypothetical protein
MATEPESQKIYVIRSVWRRLKKGRITKVARDLQSVKDVKGGGVAEKYKPHRSGADTAHNQ